MSDDTQLRDAVARLIRQLEMNEWTNKEGHTIKTNIAFQDVKKLLLQHAHQ
jgi:hypothetical protein